MSAATLASPAITDFASAVRAALGDLTPDEVDDLTDGLEADLTERLADGDQVELGDPLAYAEELRSAAGLPRRTMSSTSSVLADLRALPGTFARELRAFAGRHPAAEGVGRFLLSIRPLWWVFRGVVVTCLVMNVLGWGVTTTAVVGLLVTVVSIQFGRGRWLPFRWMRQLLLIANVLLAIAAPFLLAGVATQLSNVVYSASYAESTPDYSGTGLLENGNPVGNIFAYDAQGRPLTDVQLFDQDGHPLNLVGDPTTTSEDPTGSGNLVVPNSSVPGRLGWNVFPLSHVAARDLADDGTVKPSATPLSAVAPFGTAKPLVTADTPTPPSPTASPTPAP
jgi:hypothetical protein